MGITTAADGEVPRALTDRYLSALVRSRALRQATRINERTDDEHRELALAYEEQDAVAVEAQDMANTQIAAEMQRGGIDRAEATAWFMWEQDRARDRWLQDSRGRSVGEECVVLGLRLERDRNDR